MSTPSTRERRRSPALIVNTGDGKGKTTAAMGVALRAWSQGWSIAVFQFIKSGEWPSGERAALEALGRLHGETGEGGSVTWRALGTGRTGSETVDAASAADAAREAWSEVREALAQERFDLFILDEFTYPLDYGWIELADVVGTLEGRPGTQHVIVTGRRAPAELLEIATTVTAMDKVKHPFDAGQRGQAGIEW